MALQRGRRHLIEPRDLGDDLHLAVALDRGAIMRRLRAIHHHAGERQSAPPDRLDRQQRVIDGAERRARDEDDRQFEFVGEVDDEGRVGERHHQAAGALDHQRPVAGGRDELLHVDGDAGPARRLMRGDRLGQHISLGQDALGRGLGQPAHDRGIRLRMIAGLHRLPVARAEPRHEPGGNDRLADIGVGPGDEKALHLVL